MGIGITGCELGGLSLQKSEVFHPHVLDPHQHMTAWQFLKERSDSTLQDTVLLWMKRAVEYAGMDSSQYQDTGRTFIFLHNDAVTRISKGKITTDCYFGKYQIVEKDANGDTVFNTDGTPKMRPATSWKDYPKQQIKDYLEYLIIKGSYSFENLTALNTTVHTLLPAGADSLNPQSIMTMLVTNDGNSNIELNNFFGSAGSVKARTGGILCTNGPVHVIDRVLYYQKK
jgi:hypothetical protein